MIIILFGPPASGKGTQSRKVAGRFGLQHLATGDMLRDEISKGTAIGQQVQALLDAGKFAPNDVVLKLVDDRMATAAGNILFDGFPRDMAQAEGLEATLAQHGQKIDALVMLDVPEVVVKQRIIGRALAEGRRDDGLDVFPQRWQEYTTKTLPVIEHYQGQGNFFRVDGNQPIETVFADICKALDSAVGKQSRGL